MAKYTSVQYETLFQGDYHHRHLYAFNEALNTFYKTQKALLLEITKVSAHIHLRAYKHHVYRSLFQELFDQLKKQKDELNKSYSDLLTEYSEEEDRTTKRFLMDYQSHLFLIEYLVNQFLTEYSLKSKGKEEAEDNVFESFHSYNKLYRGMNVFQIRFSNALRDFMKELQFLIDQNAENDLLKIVRDRLICFGDVVYRGKEILRAYEYACDKIMDLVRSTLTQKITYFIQDSLTPLLRTDKNQLFLLSDDNSKAIYPRFYFNTSKYDILALAERNEVFGEMLAFYLRPSKFKDYKANIETRLEEKCDQKSLSFFRELNQILPKKQWIRKEKLLVIDFETTSPHVGEAIVVEIGLVEIDLKTLQIKPLIDIMVKDHRFNYEKHGEADIFVISSLKPQEIDKAIPLDYILPYLQSIIATTPITSFMTDFDLNILRYCLNIEVPYPHDCIMEKSKYILNIPHDYYGIKNPSLKEAYFHYFQKPLEKNHRAFADAVAAAEIVVQMIKLDQYKPFQTPISQEIEEEQHLELKAKIDDILKDDEES